MRFLILSRNANFEWEPSDFPQDGESESTPRGDEREELVWIIVDE